MGLLLNLFEILLFFIQKITKIIMNVKWFVVFMDYHKKCSVLHKEANEQRISAIFVSVSRKSHEVACGVNDIKDYIQEISKFFSILFIYRSFPIFHFGKMPLRNASQFGKLNLCQSVFVSVSPQNRSCLITKQPSLVLADLHFSSPSLVSDHFNCLKFLADLITKKYLI